MKTKIKIVWKKNYQQPALSIMATQAYEAYVEEEDVTTERRKKL